MRKRRVVGILVLLILMNIVSGCHSEKTIEDNFQHADSGEGLITEFSGEKEDADQDEEKKETESAVTAPTSLSESVAESMRAELDYSLPEEEFSEIAEMLREMETDRRAGDFKVQRTLAPGNYAFRVYADISDDTLFFHRKPYYYVWAESCQELYSWYGESKEGYCFHVTDQNTDWWHTGGAEALNLDEYDEDKVILLYEGEYVIEDTTEQIGYNFTGKEEMLTALWQKTLRSAYGGYETLQEGYENYPEFHLSTGIIDFTRYSIPHIWVDLYYNWSVELSGMAFWWNEPGDFELQPGVPEEIDYSAMREESSRKNSVIFIDGTVKKDWHESIRTKDLTYDEDRKLNGICGTIVGAMGDIYLEQTGTIAGDFDAVCYLTEMNAKTGRGEGWLFFSDQKPIKISVDYDHETLRTPSKYTYEIDKTAVLGGEEINDYLLKLEVDLTTDCPDMEKEQLSAEENKEVPAGREEFANHSGYLDEMVQNKYPTLDYDGDGIDDRFYDGDADGLFLHFGNGDKLFVGKNIDSLYVGFARPVDVTGDGISELIYCNRIFGTRYTSNYYGVWQLVDHEWRRIPISEGDTEENERLAGEFTYISVVVERLSDTQLNILQPDTGASEIIDIGYAAMEYFWPAGEKSVHTLVRGENINLEEYDSSGEMALCATVRIGTGELVGRMMYLDGQWVIHDIRLQIVGEK
ncbi:MAG: hypothetical protein IJZ85_11670 [Lachnospiraceae bacterium]|nr:hypothetical protein [Lachnospiraceae bacterium]